MPGTVLSTLFCMYLLILRRAYEVYAIIIPILQMKLLGSKVTL